MQKPAAGTGLETTRRSRWRQQRRGWDWRAPGTRVLPGAQGLNACGRSWRRWLPSAERPAGFGIQLSDGFPRAFFFSLKTDSVRNSHVKQHNPVQSISLNQALLPWEEQTSSKHRLQPCRLLTSSDWCQLPFSWQQQKPLVPRKSNMSRKPPSMR